MHHIFLCRLLKLKKWLSKLLNCRVCTLTSVSCEDEPEKTQRSRLMHTTINKINNTQQLTCTVQIINYSSNRYSYPGQQCHRTVYSQNSIIDLSFEVQSQNWNEMLMIEVSGFHTSVLMTSMGLYGDMHNIWHVVSLPS